MELQPGKDTDTDPDTKKRSLSTPEPPPKKQRTDGRRDLTTSSLSCFRLQPTRNFKNKLNETTKSNIMQILDLPNMPSFYETTMQKVGMAYCQAGWEYWDKKFDPEGPTLREIAKKELFVYRYHCSTTKGSDTGRLWTMQYGIAQQVARMDPRCYLMSLLARTDGNLHLTAYPEPAIASFGPARDISTVRYQTTPYDFDDEPHQAHPLWFIAIEPKDRGSLVILKHLTRPVKASEQYIDFMTGAISRNAQGTELQVETKPHLEAHMAQVPKQAIIHHPTTPIITTNTSEDALYFPITYLATTNHAKFEAPNADTPTFIKKCHETLTSPSVLLSGEPIPIEGRITTPWEASMRVNPPCALSAALIGAIPWTHPSVQIELAELINWPVGYARTILARIQEELCAEARRAFRRFQRLEMRIYGVDSGFFCLKGVEYAGEGSV